MATNGTIGGMSPPIRQGSEASGSSIFWAMATLALNAILQPSTTGYVWSGDTFKESLWPHRSSPFVCLNDAAFDAWVILERYRHPGQHTQHQEYAKPTVVVMRLALFVLVVLPQAIKLFSCRGIPVTQAIATAFLVSTVISMARCVHLESPYEDVGEQRGLIGPPDKSKSLPRWGVVLRGASVALHITATGYLWPRIFDAVYIESSEDFINAVRFANTLVIVVWLTYVAQHVFFMVVKGRPVLGRSAPLFILGYMLPTKLVERVLVPVSRKPITRGSESLRLLFALALGSYGLAFLMELCAKALLACLSGRAHDESELPTTSPDADGASSSGVSDNSPANTVSIQALVDSASSDDLGVHHEGSPRDAVITQTSPDHASTADNDRKDDERLPLIIRGAIWPLYFPMVIMAWAGVPLFQQNPGPPQDSAEQGTAGMPDEGTTIGPTNTEGTRSDGNGSPTILQRAFVAVEMTVKAIVRLSCLIIWRWVASCATLFVHSFQWIERKLNDHLKDRVWVAFGILNIVTSIVYYLATFDAGGTHQPSWTSLLG
ncbi:hypothetical protein LTR56_013312 [Elasticomyces elasticus]|nr:hypothetical protein LTR56_013312 [Elasticomyces elasticus]KAK3668444.1 hypothetical protein LTR22_000737 [Elasticomyces elasticus]KAK4930867.1 hypothetical protein LTR49_002632 [Elasticomyces elasticus]KAK5753682.1 hypothetical protein LTS12_016207 [Elasticomyces elasticus]